MSITLAWIGIWSTCLLLIGMLHKSLVRSRIAKAVLLPGVIVDSMLRVLSCLVTATPIERINLLAEERPPVETGKSLLGPLGACFGALFRCSALLVLTLGVLAYFPEFVDSGFALPLIDEDTVEEGVVDWSSVPGFWEQLAALPEQLGLSTIAGWLLLYTFVATLIFTGLQKREFIWLAAAWSVVLFAAIAADWLGLRFGWFSRGWFIQILYVPEWWSGFSLLVLLTILVATTLGMARGVRFFWRQPAGHDGDN